MFPHNGPATSWLSEYVAATHPTTMSVAPKCLTKNGSSGSSMLKPKMSMNVMPRIGSKRRNRGTMLSGSYGPVRKLPCVGGLGKRTVRAEHGVSA
jgi:hypothetical protein